MGFGLISLGWLFFADIPWKIDLLADFIGCYLIIAGCRRLKPYSAHFESAVKWFGVLLVPSVAITVLEIVYALMEKQQLSQYLLHLEIAHTLIFTLSLHFLLMGLIQISTDVGRGKIARKCRRNLGITAVAILFYVLTRLLANMEFANKTVTNTIGISWLIANVLWYWMLVLHFIQIFSCYMWICYEGDEDMPIKESAFKTNPYARFEKKKADREAAKESLQTPKKKKKKK
ncbi:MAG: hypothetical protein E7616_03550 [Ruminococcaceae bacterium]|nr:hypothetical protein [Oscillospiraceae bacterium]